MKQLIGLIIVGLLISSCSFAVRNIGKIETTVELTRDAERVCRGDVCNYEVYTDQGVFANKDELWHLKFNSADLQGAFVDGATCKITAIGFRIPALSMRKNIIEADCVTPLE